MLSEKARPAEPVVLVRVAKRGSMFREEYTFKWPVQDKDDTNEPSTDVQMCSIGAVSESS